MLENFVIGRIGTEDELRAVRAVDEPVRILAVDQTAQVRVRVEVLLVLQLFDRVPVPVAVAVARIDRRAGGAAVGLLGKNR